MKNTGFITLVAFAALVPDARANHKACESLVAQRAVAHAESRVADDCFSRYVQPAKADPSLYYVGVACDHTGSWQYQMRVKADGALCKLIKLSRKALDRDL